jgi:V/A-type H+-transporting ATPase subunit C
MDGNYNAISAKLQAMYSNHLTDNDFKQLLEKKSVNDICAYLKNDTAYAEVLSGLDERDAHRGHLEFVLKQKMLSEYMRMYQFMDLKKRNILKFWWMRHEIEYLKRSIRYIFNHEKQVDDVIDQQNKDFFMEHTKIDWEALAHAKTFSDCVKACENTPYADVLARAENLNADLFSVGMLLDSYYYVSLWRAKDLLLDKEGAKIFETLIGPTIDMLNMTWIYRGIKYFHFDKELIYTYLIPVRYLLTEEMIIGMVEAESPEAMSLIAQKTRYAPLFDGVEDGFFVEENYRRMMNQRAKSVFVNHPRSMAAVFAYFNLQEVEIFNVTMVIEGIRYSLNTDFIRQHVRIEA